MQRQRALNTICMSAGMILLAGGAVLLWRGFASSSTTNDSGPARAESATTAPQHPGAAEKTPVNSIQDSLARDRAALAAIVRKPDDTSGTIKAQRARVILLLDEKRYGAALIEARRYYNVAGLGQTQDALELMKQAADNAERAGATTLPAREETGDSAASSPAFIKGISLDDLEYQPALTKVADGKGNVGNLFAQGNLMLLAGRPAEARVAFEAALDRVAGKGGKIRLTREAVEGIARCIRAEEGAVEPADRYILALRSSNPQSGKERDAKAAAELVTLSRSYEIPPVLETERSAAEASLPTEASQIQLVSDFEGCAPLDVKRLSPTHFAVAIQLPIPRNWFMFRLRGVAHQVVRVDITNIDTNKWRTLNPVYSYMPDLIHDPLTPEANGSPGEYAPRSARNGAKLPDTSSQQWHFIEQAWISAPNTLSFVQQFVEESAYVAMRPPYTPGYNQAFLANLKSNPIVSVMSVGESTQRRQLELVKIAASESAQRTNPCVLMYAREHANEQDSSWVVQGAINYLISDDPGAMRARSRITFILIPILDPDGASSGVYEHITHSFHDPEPPIEAAALARFILRWVTAGKRLDVIVNLHNVESAEQIADISCPVINAESPVSSAGADFDDIVWKFAHNRGFTTPLRHPKAKTYAQMRFGGWIAQKLGGFHTLYEVNSESPSAHLDLSESRRLGQVFVEASEALLETKADTGLLRRIDAVRGTVLQRWRDSKDQLPSDHDPFLIANSIGFATAAAERSAVDTAAK